MQQIKAGESFVFLGMTLLPQEVADDNLSCDGCHFYRMICGSMGCMVTSFACHPDDNDLGQDLIIKKVK